MYILIFFFLLIKYFFILLFSDYIVTQLEQKFGFNQQQQQQQQESPRLISIDEFCNQLVSKGNNLMIDQQQQPEKSFACPRCLKCFKVKGNMVRHFKNECMQEPKFSCPYCPFRSRQTSNVLTHVRIKHTNKRVYYYTLN